MDSSFYSNVLYPFQDEVLRVVGAVETGFYLSGGTAASRGYLQHRFSDDLDLFVNDEPRFGLWSDRLIQGLAVSAAWKLSVISRDERFVRVALDRAGASLKVELVNDVPAHVGPVAVHPILGRLDSEENLLANKVTALLDRQEPKDMADVWGFCCVHHLSLERALTDASSKAAGVFPADLARILLSVTPSDWQLVRWIHAPEQDRYLADLRLLGEKLLLLDRPR